MWEFHPTGMTSRHVTMLIGNQGDMMRYDVVYERLWPRVEIRSSQMT